MKRILELTPFIRFDETWRQIKNGAELPRHHLWWYDQIQEHGYQSVFFDFNRDSRLNKFGKKIWIENLQQQIDCLKRTKEYDIVFDPFMQFTFLLALLRWLGIFNKPIIATSQATRNTNKRNGLKKIRLLLVRYIYFKGIDLIIFLNPSLYRESKQFPVWGNCTYLKSWGADFEFFDSFSRRQTKPPSSNFIYSTGASGREYNTLIKAFHEIDFPLRISVKNELEVKLAVDVSQNVQIDYSKMPKPGGFSTHLILQDYYDSLAVAICLEKVFLIAPFGYTILMEALAMGKPVISTVNATYPFDIEKEKIGILVDHYDVEGWRQAITYLITHPDEAREMGERAKYLTRTKYNYQLSASELFGKINQFLGHQTPLPVSIK